MPQLSPQHQELQDRLVCAAKNHWGCKVPLGLLATAQLQVKSLNLNVRIVPVAEEVPEV